MRTKLLGLLLTVGLLSGGATAAQADYWHPHRYWHPHPYWHARPAWSISVGTGPDYGYPYASYGGYNYYPSNVAPAGSYPVIFNAQFGSYGWWGPRHVWHYWHGPHYWRR